MRMRSWWLVASLVALSATSDVAHADKAKKAAANPRQDDAEGDDAPKVISVSLLAGYGHTFDAHQQLNPLAVGFGVRGGYNIDALYLGLRFMFFLGDSEDTAIGVGSEVEMVEISANSMTLGIEGGYDLALVSDWLVVRPEVGVGLVIGSAETMDIGSGPASPTDDQSSEDLYIAPGLALLVNLSDRVFAGFDAQLPIVFDSETELALTVFALAGMRF